MIIYKTTNLINGKIYIGKDKHNNPKYLGSGKRLHSAIKKYGKENFQKEILEYCESEKHMSDREKYWINHYDSTNRLIGYNLTTGGEGGDTFTLRSDDEKTQTRKLLSDSSKDWIQQLYVREFGNKLLPTDFYYENGYRVMTESYHKRRGTCCGNGCRHCAYEPKHEKGNSKLKDIY